MKYLEVFLFSLAALSSVSACELPQLEMNANAIARYLAHSQRSLISNPNGLSIQLIRAAKKGRENVVRMLLEDEQKEADPSYFNSMCLERAYEKRHFGVVRLLLEDGRADPAAKNSRFLGWAIRTRRADIVRLLLDDKRADPTVFGSYYLLACIELRDDRILRMLLEDGRADPSRQPCIATASKRICDWGTDNQSTIRLLLEDGRASVDGPHPTYLRLMGLSQNLLELSADPSTSAEHFAKAMEGVSESSQKTYWLRARRQPWFARAYDMFKSRRPCLQ